MKQFVRPIVVVLGTLIGVGSFVLASQLAMNYKAEIIALTELAGWLGPVAYIVLSMLAIVVAPLGFGFLIPPAAQAFGPVLATVYSVIGWTLGSVLTWWLMRHYAKTYIKDTKLVRYIERTEKTLPRAQWYFLITVLRVALPVDVMSYALGLGSSIAFWPFLLTTVVGITPFALLSHYAAVGPLSEQLLVGVLGAVIFLGGSLYVFKKVSSS